MLETLKGFPAKGSMAAGSDGQVVVGDALMHNVVDLERDSKAGSHCG